MKSDAVALPLIRSRGPDFLALAKPRLNMLVIATTCVGFYLGGAGQFDAITLVGVLVGTALVAAGSAALNQLYERDLDALMVRTRTRPLPDGRLQPVEATWFGVVAALAGLALLMVTTNVLTAGVAAATLVTYLAVYTPLKRRTPLSTLVGAVPGALPPVIGWAAARGELGVDAWALFAIVFVWQIPHFFAIAWLYREDYARAALPLLTVLETDGLKTGMFAALFAAILVPVSWLPTLVGLTEPWYAVGATVLGVPFAALAFRFAFRRTNTHARWLFFGSLIYLPALWVLLIIGRTPAGWS